MKYIIEIPDDVQYVLLNGKADNKYYTAVRPIAELEELNSDYINEHYGELQDEAYQRGLEDGKKCLANGCVGCEYEGDESRVNPCCECARVCDDHYIPKHSDRIEVGDEVVTKTGKKYTAVSFGYGGTVCGFDKEGMWTGWNPKEVTKTGKHYDIASILEEMRK